MPSVSKAQGAELSSKQPEAVMSELYVAEYLDCFKPLAARGSDAQYMGIVLMQEGRRTTLLSWRTGVAE
jgi:hypothetical protein